MTDDDDEQSEHESAEKAEDEGKIARYESGASRNPDDWKTAATEALGEGPVGRLGHHVTG